MAQSLKQFIINAAKLDVVLKMAHKNKKKTVITIRAGVENTKLEVKAEAKNTTKIQGQGQPFRGQTLSKPRTEMLEAKAKNQGNRRKCFPKKSLQKVFQATFKKKGLQKIFFTIYKFLTIQKIVLSSS